MALGLIEAVGLSAAMAALDAAAKTADVSLIGYDKVIGVDKMIGITLHLSGEVAAVQAAVDAGKLAGSRVGTVAAAHVIPRPHEELEKLIGKYEKSFLRADKTETVQAKTGS